MKSALVFWSGVAVSVITAAFVVHYDSASEPWPCDKSIVSDQYERFDHLRTSALKSESIARMLNGADSAAWSRTASQTREYARELKDELGGCGIVVSLQDPL